MIDNSCNSVSKLLYICHENNISIHETIYEIIIENMFVEENYQAELEILVSKVNEHSKSFIITLILIISHIISENKLCETELEKIIKKLSDSKIPDDTKVIISFAKKFVEDYHY